MRPIPILIYGKPGVWELCYMAGTSIRANAQIEKRKVTKGKGKRDPSTAPRARRNEAGKTGARGFAQDVTGAGENQRQPARRQPSKLLAGILRYEGQPQRQCGDRSFMAGAPNPAAGIRFRFRGVLIPRYPKIVPTEPLFRTG